MTDEDFYILSTIAGLIILIVGFAAVIVMQNKKLANEERIIERLDSIIRRLDDSKDK